MKRLIKETDIQVSLSVQSLEILDLVYSSLINDSDNIEPNVLTKLFIVVNQSELRGFYAIFYQYIKRIKELNAITGSTKIKIADKAFEDFVNINMSSFITSDDINMISVLEDLEIEDTLSIKDDLIIRRKAYEYCIKKYTMIKNLKETASNLILNLDNLLNCVIKDYMEYNTYKTASILSEGLQIKDLTLIGADDSFDFTKLIMNIIEEKKQNYNLLNQNVLDLSNSNVYREAANNKNLKMVDICDYGLPPVDKIAHMTNQDIITLVASEGTGKTTYVAATAARELFNGYSVIFMAGETSKLKAINMVLSHFIYLRTSKPDKPGMRISWQEIQNSYDTLPETFKAEIDRAQNDLFNNPKFGYLIIVSRFSYVSFKEEVLNLMSVHPDYKWGHVIVDHIDALNRVGQFQKYGFLKEKRDLISYMYEQAIDLKNDYGIPTLFTAHTSFEAEKATVSSKKTGVRIGASSSATSKDVDVVLFFESNEELNKHKLVKISIKKFRNYDLTLFEPFVALKEFEACLFSYSTKLQGILNGDQEKMLDIKNIASEDLLD